MVVFSVILDFDISTQGIEMTVEGGIGYDLQTGRLVFSQSRPTGTANAEPFSVKFPDALELNDSAWLIDLINTQNNETVANPPAFIARYEYKGQTVSFLPQRCCDIFTNLYDGQGKIIGHPHADIKARGDGRVPAFFEVRSNETIFWSDPRAYDSSVEQVTAPVESVELLIIESLPVRYSLPVVSGLSNTCMHYGGYALTPDGNPIRVDMVN